MQPFLLLAAIGSYVRVREPFRICMKSIIFDVSPICSYLKIVTIRKSSNMAGRPINKTFNELEFELCKLEGKYVAVCNICKKTLKNTASSRLKGHRYVSLLYIC